jgi:predicted nucleotidyltransferase component of viral defense system
MIEKRDILDRAADWRLRAEVVEKDYVLGWVLAAIALDDVARHWVFKGGTCIKKCYFETYRFSEDLDFSFLPGAPYEAGDIRHQLLRVAKRVQELSGIQLPAEHVVVYERANRQGQLTYEARVGYRGPLAIPNFPRIRFDLTNREPIIDRPVRRSILHPYPDGVPDQAQVRAYSFHELLAEKVRALYERSRPRDLYDVVYLLQNPPTGLRLSNVRRILLRKCRVKGLATPSMTLISGAAAGNPELATEWVSMLGHQLPVLPELDDVLGRLQELLAWVDVEEVAVLNASPALQPSTDAGELYAPAGIQYSGAGFSLETVRFAGANRLLLEFSYSGKPRRVEPYSLRRTRTTGNVLLYAYELGSGTIKAFDVRKIGALKVTTERFQPRFVIEFIPAVSLAIPPTRLRPIARGGREASNRPYVVECIVCGRRFRRTRRNTRLRPHKSQDGWACSGRTGTLLQTR